MLIYLPWGSLWLRRMGNHFLRSWCFKNKVFIYLFIYYLFELKIITSYVVFVPKGALLDNYLYRYYQTFFPANEFKVQEVIQYSSPEYGAIINNTKLGACFRQVRYINQSSLIMTVDAALDFMDSTAVKVTNTFKIWSWCQFKWL